jgi:endonuclease YncB( thermonuclease family)
LAFARKSPAKPIPRWIRCRKIRWLLIALVVAVAALWRAVPEAPEGQLVGRASPRDGDSLVIGRRRIRLQGIDAPERGQSCGEAHATWPCGLVAEEHLGRLIAGAQVACDYFRRDRYGRYIARCEAGERELNAAMVRDGMAVSLDGHYTNEEREARAARPGIWRGPFTRPAVWRRQHPRDQD